MRRSNLGVLLDKGIAISHSSLLIQWVCSLGEFSISQSSYLPCSSFFVPLFPFTWLRGGGGDATQLWYDIWFFGMFNLFNMHACSYGKRGGSG